jgi:hypothetical protein
MGYEALQAAEDGKLIVEYADRVHVVEAGLS